MIPAKVAEWALARYEDYKAGKVDEETMCGEMVTINAGVFFEYAGKAAEEFFASVVEKRIFPEMLPLAHELAAAGASVWAVSSTNDWVVRAGVRRFGIPAEHVLGASVHIQDALPRTGWCAYRAARAKPRRSEKSCAATWMYALGTPSMMPPCWRSPAIAFAVNPNPDLEKMAQQKGWKVYWPTGTK